MKKKRSRAVLAFLSPTIIFLWCLGWGLYWIGYQKELEEKVTVKPKQLSEITQ